VASEAVAAVASVEEEAGAVAASEAVAAVASVAVVVAASGAAVAGGDSNHWCVFCGGFTKRHSFHSSPFHIAGWLAPPLEMYTTGGYDCKVTARAIFSFSCEPPQPTHQHQACYLPLPLPLPSRLLVLARWLSLQA